MIKNNIYNIFTTEITLFGSYSINKSNIFISFKISNFSKRNMFTVAKRLSPQQVMQFKKITQNKRIFNDFCTHFKSLNLEDLINDKKLIQYFHENVLNKNTVYSRAFQLALEVTYNRRHFSEKDLREIYSNDFEIVDAFKVNNGSCSQADLFTCLCTKKLQDLLGYKSNEVIVQTTPRNLSKEMTLQPEIKAILERNKSYTDNSVPDVTIQGQPFDFKNAKELSYTKNNIYLLTTNDLFPGMIKNIIHALKQQQIDIKTSDEARFYIKDVNAMIKSKPMPTNTQETAETLIEIYTFIKKNPAPEGFRLSKILPIEFRDIHDKNISDIPFSEENSLIMEELKKVHLQEGNLDAPKVKKAIMGIVDQSLLSVQNKAFHSTFGVIGKQPNTKEDVD